MTRSSPTRAVLLTLLLLVGATFVAPPARSDEDVAKQLRLLYFDGKFAEAKTILDAAPAEVRDDPGLRRALGDVAFKWAKRKDGPARRAGLLAARRNFAAARALDPTDVKSAEESMDVTAKLIELAVEAKNGAQAEAAAGWGITEGEKALEGGADSPEVRTGLADAYAVRADRSHPIDDFDQIVDDYNRGAELIASCADDALSPAKAYTRAAEISMTLAAYVGEHRPIEEEKRDDEALERAVGYATKACEQKSPPDSAYTTHIIALRRAAAAGMMEDLPRVYTDDIPKKDQIDGLKLRVPRTPGWKREKSTKDWPLIWSVKVGDDDTAVQVMLKLWEHGQTWRSKGWAKLEDIANGRFEAEKVKMSDVAAETEAHMVDPEPPAAEDDGKKKKKRKKKKKSKKGPQIWHWEVAGTMSGRNVRAAEWIWFQEQKHGRSYQLRILDWRNITNLNEPDIVQFVEHAIGTAPPDPEDEDDKKKKPRR